MDELLSHPSTNTHEAGRGSSMPRLLSDDVQRVETFALDLRRNELDVEARPVIARAPPLRNLARRLGDDASRLFVRGRRRRLVATAEHQAKDGERRSATQRRSPKIVNARETPGVVELVSIV